MEHLRVPVRDALRARRSGDAGMTLIEVVVAAVLLAVLASAVLGVILQTQATEVGNRARIAAANLAAREIDLVRERFLRTDTAPVEIADEGVVTNASPLEGGVVGDPLEIDGMPYTVVRSAHWNITGNGASACEGGSLVAYPTLGVTVEVTWPNMGSIRPVVSTATFAPDKGTGIPTTSSFVAVKVLDSDAHPNPGRTVHVTSVGYARDGLTDASGCAVIDVDPGVSGREYTVTLGDGGYVDINGNDDPSKATGLITQGQLSNSISFAYDLAGAVRLTIVDPNGATLTDADVAGSQVTFIASEFSGPSGKRVITLTGVTTTITGLWPTQYGAYIGTVAPAGGYPTIDLLAGTTVDLEVPFELASTTVTGLPAGTSSVLAVPSDGTPKTCASAGIRAVDAGDVSLLPGSWDFFAVGATFGCSPGPSAAALTPGVNDPVAWAATTVRVTGAPAGTLWAAERSKVAGAPTTCPGAAASAPVNIDGARTQPVALPAGDWYLYVTNGAATGACVSYPTAYNPQALLYGQPNTLAWPTATAKTVTVTGVPRSNGRYPQIAASAATISGNCSSSNFPNGGATRVLMGNAATVSASLAPGTWYIYQWDQRSTADFSPRCVLGGTVIVAWNPLTLAFGTPGTVGP